MQSRERTDRGQQLRGKLRGTSLVAQDVAVDQRLKVHYARVWMLHV